MDKMKQITNKKEQAGCLAFPHPSLSPLGILSLVPTNTSLSLLTPLLHWAIALSSGSVLELSTTPAHWAVINPCSITLGQSSVWGNLLDAVCMFWTALLVSLAVPAPVGMSLCAGLPLAHQPLL